MSSSSLPTRASPSARSSDIWKDHYLTFRQLYIEERKTLKQVKDMMEKDHGFDPNISESTYETKLRDHLGLRKYTKKDGWSAIEHNVRLRRERYGKNSDVYRHGVRVSETQVLKEFRRNQSRLVHCQGREAISMHTSSLPLGYKQIIDEADFVHRAGSPTSGD
ncbi:hypothetical protein GQ53DRAFT_817742 [Thozetella sp. PMI_491]|nr:hypothetical protein GQ53DRAFT_817742 [Thozetella sp. PMI_491]